jgi:hypothetical protein
LIEFLQANVFLTSKTCHAGDHHARR